VNSAPPPPAPSEITRETVDPSNGASIAYWANRLMVSDATLCLLMSQFGCRVLDLQQVILNLAGERE
jgi:hypothetical protein